MDETRLDGWAHYFLAHFVLAIKQSRDGASGSISHKGGHGRGSQWEEWPSKSVKTHQGTITRRNFNLTYDSTIKFKKEESQFEHSLVSLFKPVVKFGTNGSD